MPALSLQPLQLQTRRTHGGVPRARRPRQRQLRVSAFLWRKKDANQGPKLSVLEAFFRKNPFFRQFGDGTMLLGDSVMIWATQYSSGEISYSDSSFLASILFLCWISIAASRGDYSGKAAGYNSDEAMFNLGIPVFNSMVQSCITWAGMCTLAVAIFAFLISHNLMEPGPVWDIGPNADIPPETEVLVALLITMSCWRALLQRFRISPFL